MFELETWKSWKNRRYNLLIRYQLLAIWECLKNRSKKKEWKKKGKKKKTEWRKKVTENWGAGFSSSTIFSHLRQSLPQSLSSLSLFKFSFSSRSEWVADGEGCGSPKAQMERKWKRGREREMGKGVNECVLATEKNWTQPEAVCDFLFSLYFLSFFHPLHDIRATSVVESKLYTYSFDFLSLYSLFLTLSFSLKGEEEN